MMETFTFDRSSAIGQELIKEVINPDKLLKMLQALPAFSDVRAVLSRVNVEEILGRLVFKENVSDQFIQMHGGEFYRLTTAENGQVKSLNKRLSRVELECELAAFLDYNHFIYQYMEKGQLASELVDFFISRGVRVGRAEQLGNRVIYQRRK